MMRCGLVVSFGTMLGKSSRVLPRTIAKTRSTRKNWQGKQGTGETMSKMAEWYKAACSLNLAVLPRAVWFGPGDAARKAVVSSNSGTRVDPRQGSRTPTPAAEAGWVPWIRQLLAWGLRRD